MVFRLVDRLSPDDVGSRVVVRRALEGGGLGDVLGELVAWSGGVLSVRTRDGSVVAVPEGAVLAGKRVPPPPARRATSRRPAEPSAAGLAGVAARGWPPVEEAWLGGWRLGASGGWTGRANSVVPLGDPGLALDDALARVRAWYAERGLAALAQVEVGGELDRALEGRGWLTPPGDGVLVQTAPVEALARRLGAPPAAVALAREPPGRMLRDYHGRGPVPPEGVEVLRSPRGAVRFAAARVGDEVVALGRGVVLDGWLGVSAVDVDPAHRRRGHARGVLAALVAAAPARGASSCYLQVEAGNAPAVALYAGLGFTTHHRYRYRRAP